MTILGVYYNQTVEYECNYGCSVNPLNHTITGAEPIIELTITCQSDGTWDSEAIVCKRKSLLLHTTEN